MSRKVVGIAGLLVLGAGLVFLAIRGPKGFRGLFGSSDDTGSATGPGELTLDGDASGREGAAGKGSARDGDADRAGSLASRHIERRGVGGLSMKIVRAGSGAAIEGATVLVVGTGHGGEEVRANAVTDAIGAAKFERLAAGQGYVVRIAAKADPAVDRPDVEIRAGRDKDLGTIEIGATVALTGRVVDETGKPVGGAQVRVLTGFENILDMLGNMAEMFGTLGREPTPLAKGTTADDGRFRFEGLPPGALVIVAGASGKRQTVFPFRMTAKGPASGEPTLVLEAGAMIGGVVVDSANVPIAGAHLSLLETGDNDPNSFMTKRTFTTTGVDGRFRALIDDGARDVRAVVDAAGFPTTISAALKPGQDDAKIVLIGGATVEVSCEDEAHRPVEGAQVAMMVARGNLDSPDGVGGTLYGSTDSSGAVTFASGPGKIEMIIVNHRDFASVMGSPGRGEGEGMPFKLDGDIPKEVQATGITKIAIRMKRGLAIRGRVLDPSGNPIPGAEVRTIGGMGFGGGASTRAAADGTFRVTGGAPPEAGARTGGFGGTMIIVRAAGWIQKEDSMSVDVSQAKDGELVHDVTLIAGAVVRGKVLDADGSPFAGAEVRVSGGSGFGAMEALGAGTAHTTTTAEGTYELRDVSPVEPPSAAAPSVSGESNDLRGAIAARAGASERGGARVSITAENRVAARSEPFGIEAGATVDAPTIKLSAGATLRGKVREPGGRPVALANVEVSMERNPEDWMYDRMKRDAGKRSVKSDADGGFVVTALGKGKGSVVATATGFAGTRAVIEVGDADPAPIELRLFDAADLRGRVATTSGEVIAGATVVVSTPSGTTAEAGNSVSAELRARATTDKDGGFVLKGLPKVMLRVTVIAKGHRNRTLDAVPGGEALDVRLEIRPPNDELRRDEIKKELAEIYAKFATVKADDERNALIERMSALQIEQRDLDGEAASTPSSPK